MKIANRILSVVMALVMLLSLMPMQVFATDGNTEAAPEEVGTGTYSFANHPITVTYSKASKTSVDFAKSTWTYVYAFDSTVSSDVSATLIFKNTSQNQQVSFGYTVQDEKTAIVDVTGDGVTHNATEQELHVVVPHQW